MELQHINPVVSGFQLITLDKDIIKYLWKIIEKATTEKKSIKKYRCKY